MSIQIEILDSQVDALREFYIKRIRTLRDEIAIREREIRDTSLTIQKLKKANGQETVERPSNIEYSDKWPWVKKVHFAISLEGKPLTTKEIVDTLSEFEPSFIYDRKRAVASISSILSTKSGQGKEFKRVDSDSSDFAYAIIGEDEEVENEKVEPIDDLPF